MNWYARYIDKWERKLATRDNNRVVRPLDWGLEWLHEIDPATSPEAANGDAPRRLERFVESALGDSAAFFSYSAAKDYNLREGHLTFSSPVPTPYRENNTVHAGWFPARNHGGRALVVLPQWNADAQGHAGLCRLLNRFGVSALRMTMPYHAERMPPELERADYHVSSNIGRTIHATRQSVIDARACLDWLQGAGYTRLGILGTSLGSCVAFITAAHDERIGAGIFNHVSMYFSDVIWTGLACQHIRRGFGDGIEQSALRRYWSPISPAAYFDHMAARRIPSLLIWARHDSSFLPVYSHQVIDRFRTLELPHRVFTLPCGHYTTGRFPFNVMDGMAMCRFAVAHL